MTKLQGLARGRSSAAGFTLVELVVTLTIVVILSLVAVPGMLDLIRDARLSAQTDLLVSTLNTARLEAIKRRTNVTVCPVASDANTATACSANAAHWANGMVIWDGTAIVQRIQNKSGLTLTTTATSVVFNATLGSATAAPSFTLCTTGRKQQQVDVAMSGHVSKRTNSTTCS